MAGSPADESVVVVTFELTEDDLLAFTRAFLTRTWFSWLVQQLVLAYWLIPYALLVLIYTIVSLRSGAPITWSRMALLVAMAFIILMLARGLRDRPRRLVKVMLRLGQNRLLLAKQTITVGSEGVEWRGSGGHRFYRWFAVLRLHETASHAFIYIDYARAFIVPARAFASPDAFHHFIRLIKGYLANAQAYGLTCPKCHYDLRGEIEPGCPECGWRREGALDEPRYTS